MVSLLGAIWAQSDKIRRSRLTLGFKAERARWTMSISPEYTAVLQLQAALRTAVPVQVRPAVTHTGAYSLPNAVG